MCQTVGLELLSFKSHSSPTEGFVIGVHVIQMRKLNTDCLGKLPEVTELVMLKPDYH
jgi:hypothetical protein